MPTTVRAVSDIAVPAPPTNHQTRAVTSTSTVTSPKRLARIAGVPNLRTAWAAPPNEGRPPPASAAGSRR